MKCICAIVNVRTIRDVVYYVDTFLTLCEILRFLTITLEPAKPIGKKEEKVFTEDICDKNVLHNTHVN